jgi:hypothetical protein
MTINNKKKMFEFFLKSTKIQTPLFTEGRYRSREKEKEKSSLNKPHHQETYTKWKGEYVMHIYMEKKC